MRSKILCKVKTTIALENLVFLKEGEYFYLIKEDISGFNINVIKYIVLTKEGIHYFLLHRDNFKKYFEEIL